MVQPLSRRISHLCRILDSTNPGPRIKSTPACTPLPQGWSSDPEAMNRAMVASTGLHKGRMRSPAVAGPFSTHQVWASKLFFGKILRGEQNQQGNGHQRDDQGRNEGRWTDVPYHQVHIAAS